MSDPLLEGQKYWLWKTRRLYDSLAIAVPPDRLAKAGTKLGFRVEDVIIAGLTIVKFVHLSALMVLFGCGAFPLYAKKPDGVLHGYLRDLVLTSAITALTSGVLWFAFPGPGLDTTFGQVLIVRLLLIAGASTLFARKSAGAAWSVAVVLSAVAVATIAWTGHARNGVIAGAGLHLLGDMLHLIAAGVWIGALAWLLLLLTPYTQAPRPEIEHALAGFSGIGPGVVAMLVITGIVNSLFLIGPQNAVSLWRKAYGLTLLIKLALFALMFALAAVNRYRLTPRLAMAADRGSTEQALRAFKGTIAAETALAVLGLAAVALMGVLPTPTD
jgi:putative copper resistance protein D